MQSFQKHTENSPSPPATYYGYYIAPNYNPQTMQYNAPNQMAMVIGSSSQHYPGSIVPEVPEVKGLQFSTESIRKGFIRKVYSILLIQLLLTLVSIILFTYHLGVRKFTIENIWIFYAAVGIGFVTFLTLMCCESVRYSWPINLIVLFIFTIAWSCLIGLSTLLAPPELVLQAIGLTAVAVAGLTIFAIQTKWDFTVCGGVLFVAGLLFLVVILILSFTEFGKSNANGLIVSSFGVLLFSVYLIYDTQMIVGGERKSTLTPEEYIAGAIMLYLDIVNIFIHILYILLGLSND